MTSTLEQPDAAELLYTPLNEFDHTPSAGAVLTFDSFLGGGSDCIAALRIYERVTDAERERMVTEASAFLESEITDALTAVAATFDTSRINEYAKTIEQTKQELSAAERESRSAEKSYREAVQANNLQAVTDAESAIATSTASVVTLERRVRSLESAKAELAQSLILSQRAALLQRLAELRANAKREHKRIQLELLELARERRAELLNAANRANALADQGFVDGWVDRYLSDDL
jgi:hypothetical protein